MLISHPTTPVLKSQAMMISTQHLLPSATPLFPEQVPAPATAPTALPPSGSEVPTVEGTPAAQSKQPSLTPSQTTGNISTSLLSSKQRFLTGLPDKPTDAPPTTPSNQDAGEVPKGEDSSSSADKMEVEEPTPTTEVPTAEASSATGDATPIPGVVSGEGTADAPMEIVDDDADIKPITATASTASEPQLQALPPPPSTFAYPGGFAIDVAFEASKLPLDVAIFNSARAAGGDEKIRKYLQAVLVIGGTALVPGMAHALESR